MRYEAQTLIADQLNFSPRVTMTWSPFKSGKTTFRAGYGRFTDWLGLGTYEQTLRLDGSRQQEVNIIDPAYPDPGHGRHDAADQPVLSSIRASRCRRASWPTSASIR